MLTYFYLRQGHDVGVLLACLRLESYQQQIIIFFVHNTPHHNFFYYGHFYLRNNAHIKK